MDRLKKVNRTIAVLIIMIFVVALALMTGCNDNKITNEVSIESIEEQLAKTGNYLYSGIPDPSIGSVGGDWVMVGLSKSPQKVKESYIKKYVNNVQDLVRDKKGNLDDRKYTTYSRVIIGLTSVGEDPTNIDGYNLIEKLSDYNRVIYQGINGPIWALIAVDSGNYEFPKVKSVSEQTSRESLIDYIIKAQLDDGGWNLAGDTGDIDITSMALNALNKYRNNNSEVNKAVENAVEFLSLKQNTKGGYSSWGKDNCESCAQVITALSAMGIDCQTDERFIKDGNSVLNAMLNYEENGGFKHEIEGETDEIPTEQAYYALVSYYRFEKGMTGIFQPE